MWSSGGEEMIRYKDKNKRRAPSCSSSQSHSPSSPLQPQEGKDMEEVWKNISLSPLHHHSNRPQVVPPHHHDNIFGGINLEDLATPFSRDPPPNLGGGGRSRWCSGVAPAPAPAPQPQPQPKPQPQRPQKPPPSRMSPLCFPSVPEFHCVDDNNDPLSQHLPPLHNHSNDFGSSFVPSLMSTFGSGSGSGSGPAFPPFAKKRGSESEDNSKVRRHERMIKNRDSASRCRARKQAYICELENKVDSLTKENERLLKQQKELYLAAEAAEAAAAPQQEKSTLQRRATTPF